MVLHLQIVEVCDGRLKLQPHKPHPVEPRIICPKPPSKLIQKIDQPLPSSFEISQLVQELSKSLDDWDSIQKIPNRSLRPLKMLGSGIGDVDKGRFQS